MLYQSLYGIVPFMDKTSLDALAQKILTGEIRYPPSVVVSPLLKELIGKMLTVDEEKRANIVEVKRTIDALCAAY